MVEARLVEFDENWIDLNTTVFATFQALYQYMAETKGCSSYEVLALAARGCLYCAVGNFRVEENV